MLIPEEPTNCDVDWGSDGVVDETSGTVNGVTDSEVTPTAAEVRDGGYVVTSLERTATITYTVEGFAWRVPSLRGSTHRRIEACPSTSASLASGKQRRPDDAPDPDVAIA